MTIRLNILKNSYVIILSAVLGALFGLFFTNSAVLIKPIGDIFISLLKMLVVPIILFGIVGAISKLGNSNNVTKLSLVIIGSFVGLSTLSGGLGAVLAVIFNLGSGVESSTVQTLLESNASYNQDNFKFITLVDFLKGLIPSNPFNAIFSGNMLQILFFSILIGFSIVYIENTFKQKVILAIDVINDALINIVNIVMYLAPFGLFSLMAYLAATFGVDVLYDGIKLILLVLLGLFVWLYVILSVVVIFFTNIKYLDFIKKIIPLQIMAFSSASSIASLPVNLKTCENLGINKNIYSIVLPLGAVINMNGSSLFYCISVIFCAQMFNIELSLLSIIIIVIVSMLGSIATPGIPGLSLTIIMVMIVANVPLVALPLIIAVDRILDMFITVVNVVGDTVVSAIASKYN